MQEFDKRVVTKESQSVVKQVDKIGGLFNCQKREFWGGAPTLSLPRSFHFILSFFTVHRVPSGPTQAGAFVVLLFCVFFDLFDFQSVDVEGGLLR